MTKRIIGYVLTALLIIALIIVTLTIQAVTNVMGKKQETKLRELLDILYHAYGEKGTSFIDSLETEDYTITVFSSGGEIVSNGYGLVRDRKALNRFLNDVISTPGTIVSTSSSFLFGNLVLAGITTDDGMTLVVSTTLNTFSDTILDMRIELLYIILVCIIISSFISRLISYLIVRPLNEIDTDSPKECTKKYEEIQPLINKITEQKEDLARQEQQLRSGEERFRAISGALMEGMVLIENDRTISYINQSAINFLSLSSSPAGKEYNTVFDSTLTQIVDSTILSGNQKSVIYPGSRAYQVETSHLSLADGNYDGVSILIYDVTDAVNLERDRRDFTANVSHELKTPLHIISGSAELLKLGIVKEKDRKTFIDQIYNETRRMKELIDDIIRLSKLDEHTLLIEREVLSVRAEAEKTIESLRDVAGAKDISLMITGEDAKIRCNRVMFSQILYNLVDNAIKYSNEHGKVETSVGKENGSVYIDVIDNGIGIPEEYHRRIFERFFRVDKSRSKEVGGTGLGLAIVKSSCLENGGDVEVKSSVMGKGTTFRVTFPSCEDKG